jgi:hypothetical protein
MHRRRKNSPLSKGKLKTFSLFIYTRLTQKKSMKNQSEKFLSFRLLVLKEIVFHSTDD